MKQIRLAFCFMSEDWLLCFLLIGQLKVRFHFQRLDPLQKVISRAKLFALRSLLRGIPSSLCWIRLWERGLVILAPILLRDPLIVAFCCWPVDPRWPLDIILPVEQTRVKASRPDISFFKKNKYQFSAHYFVPILTAALSNADTWPW